MITGIIKNGRATVNVIFRLPDQPDFTIEFVIDTGFTEFLSLPPRAVNLLNLPFVYDMYANLADNSRVLLPVHQTTIIWNGEEREVNVLATGKLPLLGTALLDGYELSIQFTEGGLVAIEEL
ncbi:MULTISPECIES: clan AA aspartic protease [unclassified Sphaerospermopsis]|uniref:clan AA aspartic protease n=1 Tax=unclassified Sphaerospermopsis TaxID=2646443 RepID=UPI0016807580|nr:clan AA aspartic protease [Sphaerospermopsis sp. FACHB-1094]MBD2147896.1 clan AA aspartic protease [Sphaerospermopsis sp. FACHB-1194]